jgi:hypothetical protein
MKSKFILCLVLILCSDLFGCATRHYPDTHADSDVKLPVRFKNYQELYAFISREVFESKSVSSNPNTLFKLAADSETEPYALDNPPFYLWIITPRYFNGGIYDQIRGAQGNGVYYIIRPLARNFASDKTDCGFELVGIAHGNALSFSDYNQTTRLTTYSHISATEHPGNTYEWNGKIFEQVK